MDMSLFASSEICFTALEIEKDAPVEATWSNDLDYVRRWWNKPPRPLSSFELQKMYQEMQKSDSENENRFCFAIRLRENEQLIGFAQVPHVFWWQDNALVRILFGDPQMQKRYGLQTLGMLLAYCFNELSLFQVIFKVAEYDTELCEFCEQSGMRLEVRQRQSIYRCGRFWDGLIFGLLRSDWEQNVQRAG